MIHPHTHTHTHTHTHIYIHSYIYLHKHIFFVQTNKLATLITQICSHIDIHSFCIFIDLQALITPICAQTNTHACAQKCTWTLKCTYLDDAHNTHTHTHKPTQSKLIGHRLTRPSATLVLCHFLAPSPLTHLSLSLFPLFSHIILIFWLAGNQRKVHSRKSLLLTYIYMHIHKNTHTHKQTNTDTKQMMSDADGAALWSLIHDSDSVVSFLFCFVLFFKIRV